MIEKHDSILESKLVIILDVFKSIQKDREELYNRNSEDWQDSDVGWEYDSKTQIISEVIDDINNLLPNLKKLNLI